MAKQVRLLKVLVSSPSDTKEECEVLIQEMSYWNISNSEKYGVMLSPVNWKSNSFPDIPKNGEPQTILNEQIVESADLMVAFFWTRAGTPTKEFESGTVEEIELFINEGKQILLYFSSKKVNPESLDLGQIERLRKIKEKYMKKGIIGEISSIKELKKVFPRHITSVVEKFKKNIISERQLKKLGGLIKPNKSVTESEFIPLISCMVAGFELIDQTARQSVINHNSGLSDVDEILAGFYPGDLTAIVGDTHSHKSEFLLTIALKIMSEKKKSAIYASMDGNANMHVLSLLTMDARASYYRLLRGTLPRKDYPRLSLAADMLYESNFSFFDTPGLSPRKLIESLENRCKSNETHIIFVDNIPLLRLENLSASESEYNMFFCDLKRLACEFKISLFITYPIAEKPFGTKNIKPWLSDIQGYGRILDYADNVIAVFHPSYYNKEDESIKGTAEVIVMKNARGPIGTITLAYIKDYGRYDNLVDYGMTGTIS
jgi:replicative DNA helicase